MGDAETGPVRFSFNPQLCVEARSATAMKRRSSVFLVPILVALLLANTGCSMLIASRGVSDPPTIALGSTRQEVQQTLGDPDSSETRGDGMRVETYRLRRKIESPWGAFGSVVDVIFGHGGGLGGLGGGAGALGTVALVVVSPLLFEVFYATPKAIYDSEKQKYHLVLVYGPDDRLALFYDENALPETRFATARRPGTCQ